MSKATERASAAWTERQAQMVSEREASMAENKRQFVRQFGIEPDRWEGEYAIVGNVRLCGPRAVGLWLAEQLSNSAWQLFWGYAYDYETVSTLADIGRLLEKWG